MAKVSRVNPVSAETRDQVIAVIQVTAEPQTPGQVAKLLVSPHKLTETRLAPLLVEFVTAGRLREFPPKSAKGKPRYWDRTEADLGRSLVTAVLANKGPLSQSDLRKATRQLPDDVFATSFQALLTGRSLFEHPTPPKKKSPVYGLQPPSPELYLRETGRQLAKIVADLSASGVPPGELRRAMIELMEAAGVTLDSASTDSPGMRPDAAIDLISTIRRIEPAADNGALVPSRELRRAVRIEKSQFDRIVLDLARQGKLMLHRHDFPLGLTPAERDDLVTDGAGTYYVGMALRRDADR